MKRTILALLIVALIATPCLGQEVESDGLFSLHGTKWVPLTAILIFPFPWVFPPNFEDDFAYGFHSGVVYPGLSSRFITTSFYVDMIVASFFMYRAIDTEPYHPGFEAISFGILQPIGVGVMIVYEKPSGFVPFVGVMILIKVDDNWKPLMTISIFPDEGEQGTTLTDVRIYGTNTAFQYNSPVEISFSPPDGLTVSNINVTSNTRITFDLEIADDAPTGARSVTVTYANGKQSVSLGGYAFRVNERTN